MSGAGDSTEDDAGSVGGADDAADTDGTDSTGTDGKADGPVDPTEIGERDAPPVAEKPYKVIFEANKCIGAGKCAEVSDNWELDLSTGIAKPRAYFIDEADLAHNVRAAEVCPAKKDRGVIHVIDRETGEELAPDPHDDGTVSVDW